MSKKPTILFYRCQAMKRMISQLGDSWEHKTVRSLKGFDEYESDLENVIVISDWKPRSSFASWSESHNDFTIFTMISPKEKILPEHVTLWLHSNIAAVELEHLLLLHHTRWQKFNKNEQRLKKLEKERGVQIQMADRLLEVSIELKRAKEEVEKLSLTDSLTKVNNRRYFDINLPREIMQSKRYLTPLSMYFIDIDNFKHINDKYGHQTGDQVLMQICTLIKKNLRETDWAARYGGEEFCVVLPMQEVSGSLASAIRLRRLVENNLKVKDEKGKVETVTASFGMSNYDPDIMEPDDFIKFADQALYHSKRTGKNKVTFYNHKTQEYEEHIN